MWADFAIWKQLICYAVRRKCIYGVRMADAVTLYGYLSPGPAAADPRMWAYHAETSETCTRRRSLIEI